MKVGIVGAGLIGKERIKALQRIQQKTAVEIVGLYDNSVEASHSTAELDNLKFFSNIEDLLKNNLDWVFVAVPHDVALGISSQCINYGINVLLEKPLGRNIAEANLIVAKAESKNVRLNIGLNYRFFRGTASLIKDIKGSRFGDIISAKFTLGHGNAPGMENTWKLSPSRCGGGCLIDPGIHIFDLICNCFPGTKEVISVSGWQGFWDTGIEEEACITIRGATGEIISVDLSLNRWRSDFSIQINGTNGYGRINGRGRSYGQQEYIFGRRWAWLDGPNQKDTEESVLNPYDADDSFLLETIFVLGLEHYFEDLITIDYPSPANSENAMEAMKLMAECQTRLITN